MSTQRRTTLRRTTLAVATLLLAGVLASCGEEDAPTTGVEPTDTATAPAPTPTEATEPTEPAEPTATVSEDPSGRITIESPAPGAEVSIPFEVTGRAEVFEANVEWALEDADGVEVASGFTTADEAFTLAPYAFTVADEVPAGDYVLVVFETSPEDGERSVVTSMPLRIG